MANTLAYYNTATITALKIFIVEAHSLFGQVLLNFFLRHSGSCKPSLSGEAEDHTSGAPWGAPQ